MLWPSRPGWWPTCSPPTPHHHQTGSGPVHGEQSYPPQCYSHQRYSLLHSTLYRIESCGEWWVSQVTRPAVINSRILVLVNMKIRKTYIMWYNSVWREKLELCERRCRIIWVPPAQMVLRNQNGNEKRIQFIWEYQDSTIPTAGLPRMAPRLCKSHTCQKRQREAFSKRKKRKCLVEVMKGEVVYLNNGWQ